jgi:hypothetical protein
MREIRLDITTDASGDATVTGSGFTGLLYAAQLVDGTLDDGVDITITSEQGDLSIPLLTKANFNSDQMAYPRVLESLNTDGTDLTTHALPVVFGRAKAVVAQGGNVKTGAVILYVVEV